MKCEQISYPSSDGKNSIVAYYFLPDEGQEIRGIVQICHGMTEYILRYRGLAEVLTGAGFAVCGNDDLGHGQSVASDEDLGFFAEQDGIGYVLDDLHTMTALVKERFPDLPFTLLGHSMGSFLCRLYATRFGYELDNLVVLGTGGPNPLLPFGKLLTKIISKCKGSRHRSEAVKKLAFGGYTSHFGKGAHPKSWITRDEAVIEVYAADPLCNFTFTVSAYLDLFSMLELCNSKEWFATFPKNLRTLIASGTEDPVGNYGQGPIYIADMMKSAGVQSVDLRLYDGARHELHNETNKEEFFADLLAWLCPEAKKEA